MLDELHIGSQFSSTDHTQVSLRRVPSSRWETCLRSGRGLGNSGLTSCSLLAWPQLHRQDDPGFHFPGLQQTSLAVAGPSGLFQFRRKNVARQYRKQPRASDHGKVLELLSQSKAFLLPSLLASLFPPLLPSAGAQKVTPQNCREGLLQDLPK